MRKPRQKAGDASQKATGHSTPHVDLLDTEPCSNDERGAGAAVACRDDSEQSAACHTPAPSRRMCQVADDVEVEESDTDCAPMPVLPMTARRKGRFSAMQLSEVTTANLHITQWAVLSLEKLLYQARAVFLFFQVLFDTTFICQIPCRHPLQRCAYPGQQTHQAPAWLLLQAQLHLTCLPRPLRTTQVRGSAGHA